jgi:hypothetical protein
MKQLPVPGPVELRLLSYFGGKRCVVTAEVGEWHHLDGHHDNHSLANIIPLEGALNKELGGSKNAEPKSPKWLSSALQPDSLLKQADVNFQRWRVADAYGCAHLAFFTGIEPGSSSPNSIRVTAIRRALHFARQRFNREIIEYIIEMELIPFLDVCAHIEPTERELTKQEICALLGEQGESEYAAELSTSLRTATNMGDGPQASLLRRKAQSLGMTGKHKTEVRRLLAESSDRAGQDWNQRANRANSEAFIALSEGSKDMFAKAYKEVSTLYEMLQKDNKSERLVRGVRQSPMTISNAAAIVLHRAIGVSIFRPADWKTKRDRDVAFALTLLEMAGTRLWLLRPGYWENVLHLIAKSSGDPGDLRRVIELQREPLSPSTVLHLRAAVNLLGR